MTNLDSILHTEDDLFYFESDHLALKGNNDYCEVLKTLVILSAQREKAIKDYNKVVELKKEALNDPFAILNRLQNGEDINLPQLSELPKLPIIDFQKYNIKVPESELKEVYCNIKNETEEDNTMKQNYPNNSRGWSPEEQKRLEELLITYPPEPVEMKRFQKIAKALGNRTVQQVCSRVQKYFLKLYKAGLPIPGRIPKSGEKYKKSALHKHQRHNHYLWKPTTFFPDLSVPVQMSDLDNIPGPSSSSGPTTSSLLASNYLIPSQYHQKTEPTAAKNEAELQVDLLKKVKQEKEQQMDPNYTPFYHVGYRCDYCDEQPIIGSRWHCSVCTGSVDFCTDCVLSQMYSDSCHPLNHALVMYRDDTENPNLASSDTDSFTSCTAVKSAIQTRKKVESDGFEMDFDGDSSDSSTGDL